MQHFAMAKITIFHVMMLHFYFWVFPAVMSSNIHVILKAHMSRLMGIHKVLTLFIT